MLSRVGGRWMHALRMRLGRYSGHPFSAATTLMLAVVSVTLTFMLSLGEGTTCTLQVYAGTSCGTPVSATSSTQLSLASSSAAPAPGTTGLCVPYLGAFTFFPANTFLFTQDNGDPVSSTRLWIGNLVRRF